MQAVQEAFFAGLLPDVLGFAGAVIIRRILGIAHVVDYESITDADARHVNSLAHSVECRLHAVVSALRNHKNKPCWTSVQSLPLNAASYVAAPLCTAGLL